MKCTVGPLSRSPLITSLTRSLLPFPSRARYIQFGKTALDYAKKIKWNDSEELKAGKADCAALLEAAM